MPRTVLEAKVEKYLKQSVALERFWHTPVTGEMLQAEMERQARQSRMPERLGELYAVLGDDPSLVRECLARPALVDRLTEASAVGPKGEERGRRLVGAEELQLHPQGRLAARVQRGGRNREAPTLVLDQDHVPDGGPLRQ